MKKLILVLFCIMSLAFGVTISSNGEKPGTGTINVVEPVTIFCHCTITGFCKASGGGSICAQSAPGGNIHCDEYNGNC